MKEKIEFERFRARDKDGRSFAIIGYQCVITHKPVYGAPVVLRGDIEYWTDSGLRVTKIDSKTFRIFTPAETTTRFPEKLTRFNTQPHAIEVHAITRSE